MNFYSLFIFIFYCFKFIFLLSNEVLNKIEKKMVLKDLNSNDNSKINPSNTKLLFEKVLKTIKIMANNREEAIKPEFLKLYYKLNDITELALNIDERQRKIIDKATNVNNKLEQSIKNDLNDIKLVVSAEETIKNLFQKIDNSKNLIEQIRNKINNLKENYKK